MCLAPSIVHHHNKVFVLVIIDRTVTHSGVLLANAPLDIFCLYASKSRKGSHYIFLVSDITDVLGLLESILVIIGHILLGSPCDRIMVLDDAQLVEQNIVRFKVLFDLCI